jgi:hypothetical protein
MKTLQTLAVGCALLLLVVAVTWADDGELHDVLTVSDWTQNWENLAISVENPGSLPEDGVVVFWFYDDGNLTGWGAPVNVPADSVLHFGLRLHDGGPIVIGPIVYKNPPDSITDAPEPIMQTVEPLDGGGKNKGNGNDPPDE